MRNRIQWIGLAAGPALAAVTLAVLPRDYPLTGGGVAELTWEGRLTLALMAWMATWWLTEAIEISATAMLPLVVLPIAGALSMKAAAAPYADKLIFLFMGGFIIALSMQRWGLDRRIALITLRFVGSRPAHIVAGVMIATAGLSMFVSNTATAAMMLPIALSVTALVGGGPDDTSGTRKTAGNFAICMMLGIAYAASIGGIATKIGTPPNGLLLGFIERQYGKSIGFFEWLCVGLPLTVVFLPLAWFLLTKVLYPVPRERIEGADRLVHDAYRELGPIKPGEWATLIVFVTTALLWMTRPLIARIVPGVTDAGIAMTAAVALFCIPVRLAPRELTMDWPTARRMPWGVLVLFGGGLSLAEAVRENGVAEFLGHQATLLAGWPSVVLVLAVVAAIIFLTELTSNTATAATLLPILAGLAPGLNVNPYLLLVPAGIAASCAFMMPVATPPNAIVFGSGHLTIPQMCRAGLWLNLAGILLITLLVYAVALPLLGSV